MKEDLYQVLGIAPNTKQERIAEACAEALRSHEDLGKHEDSANRLVKIKAAHEVLSDPRKREAYDEKLAETQFNQKPPPKSNKNTEATTLRKAKRRSKYGLGTLVMVTVVFGMAYIFGSIVGTDKHPTSPKYDGFNAQTECERFVSRYLKAPSTADFAPYRDLSISGNGNGPWTVVGHVDSMNSFGAKIRATYLCTVLFSGDRVSLQNLIIDGQPMQ